MEDWFKNAKEVTEFGVQSYILYKVLVGLIPAIDGLREAVTGFAEIVRGCDKRDKV